MTRAENTRRGPIPKRNASRTHCPARHPYSDENTVIHNGTRHCRICMSEHKKAHHERRLPVLGAERSFCWAGHELTPENTMRLPDGYPVCKTCLKGWTLRA